MPEDKLRKAERDYRRANANRERANQIKLECGCCDCGYNVHSAALEFDHIDSSTKHRTVASLMYGSWKTIQVEIDKCEVRCANCHQIKSVLERTKQYGEVRQRKSELS